MEIIKSASSPRKVLSLKVWQLFLLSYTSLLKCVLGLERTTEFLGVIFCILICMLKESFCRMINKLYTYRQECHWHVLGDNSP